MKKLYFILVIRSFDFIQTVAQAGPSIKFPNTEWHSLYSEYVMDKFFIQISLPPSFNDNPEKSYPVLYILDSDMSFGMAIDIVRRLSKFNESEEYIIVSISYSINHWTSIDESDWWQKRARDYFYAKDANYPSLKLAGKAEFFLDFTEHELHPFIKKRFLSYMCSLFLWLLNIKAAIFYFSRLTNVLKFIIFIIERAHSC
jgi:hypothetical protein